jgi:hypothetical protein
MDVSYEQVSVFSNTESVTGIVKQDGDLYLSNVRLSPWQNEVPSCDTCEVSVQRIDRPSGPSWVIVVTENEKIVWAFFDSKRKRINSPLAMLSIQSQQLVVEHSAETIALALQESANVGNCRFTFLSLQKEFETTEAVSNENPEVHFQVLASCAD